MTTGILEWVSTLWVTLPSSSDANPPRPCDDMKIKSHFFLRAVARMPW